eukprot:gene8345-9919_t
MRNRLNPSLYDIGGPFAGTDSPLSDAGSGHELAAHSEFVSANATILQVLPSSEVVPSEFESLRAETDSPVVGSPSAEDDISQRQLRLMERFLGGSGAGAAGASETHQAAQRDRTFQSALEEVRRSKKELASKHQQGLMDLEEYYESEIAEVKARAAVAHSLAP